MRDIERRCNRQRPMTWDERKSCFIVGLMFLSLFANVIFINELVKKPYVYNPGMGKAEIYIGCGDYHEIGLLNSKKRDSIVLRIHRDCKEIQL